MDANMIAAANLVGGLLFLCGILAASRAAHWAYATQERLQTTNKLLYELVARNGGPPTLRNGQPMPPP